MKRREILFPGKQTQRVKARSLLCYWAVKELGISTTSVASKLGMLQSSVSRTAPASRHRKKRINDGRRLSLSSKDIARVKSRLDPGPFSSDGTAKVIYESKACPRHRSGNGNTKETFDALEWLALLTTHIPNRGEQMVRYYGYYSNKCRGMRKKEGKDDAIHCAYSFDVHNCYSFTILKV